MKALGMKPKLVAGGNGDVTKICCLVFLVFLCRIIMYSSMYWLSFTSTACFACWVEGYLVACMSHYIVDPTRLCNPCIFTCT